MKGVNVAMLVVLALAAALLGPSPGEAISCGDVQGSLSLCLAYLTGSGGTEPTSSCCGGVRSLVGNLESRQDRQTACSCIKSAASSYNVRSDAASSLPRKCGVSIGMSVSPDIDCSQPACKKMTRRNGVAFCNTRRIVSVVIFLLLLE
ncbi:Non-specific lipid-transfer protein 11 [Striga hermonthica]|uniref:Non-specific lipid-transfer protein n=1 Tax=Striga hermonthica TaxID=68872 RepID=A0A9N7NC03_STRHE|nr:Non-specific lipid-transfer protein 11 [Striga hermonthica]